VHSAIAERRSSKAARSAPPEPAVSFEATDDASSEIGELQQHE
jgi:hypothetical protein